MSDGEACDNFIPQTFRKKLCQTCFQAEEAHGKPKAEKPAVEKKGPPVAKKAEPEKKVGPPTTVKAEPKKVGSNSPKMAPKTGPASKPPSTTTAVKKVVTTTTTAAKSGPTAGAEAENRKAYFMKMKEGSKGPTTTTTTTAAKPAEKTVSKPASKPAEPEPEPEPEPDQQPETTSEPETTTSEPTGGFKQFSFGGVDPELEEMKRKQEAAKAKFRHEPPPEEPQEEVVEMEEEGEDVPPEVPQESEVDQEEIERQQQAEKERLEREKWLAGEKARMEAEKAEKAREETQRVAAKKSVEADSKDITNLASSESSVVGLLKKKVASAGQLNVYIASTGSNTSSEREFFFQKYAPLLRTLAESQGVGIFFSDFGFGTEPASILQSSLLHHKLRQIESSDVFIGFAGSHHGDSPSSSEIAQVGSLFSWVEDEASVSNFSIECRAGCLRDPTTRISQFLFENNSDSGELLSLKDEVSQLASDNEGGTRLVRIKTFASSQGTSPGAEGAYSFLQALIMAVCPANFDSTQVQERMHSALLKGDGFTRSSLEFDSFISADNDPVVIVGPEGSGKTTFIAQWIAKRRETNPEDKVVFHDVAATQHTATLSGLLYHVIGGLRSPPNYSSLAGNAETLSLKLADALEQASQKQASGLVILVLDGIDKLVERGRLDFLHGESIHSLTWLPAALPANVRLIVGSRSSDDLKTFIARRRPHTVTVGSLDDAGRAELVRDVVGEASKARSRTMLGDSQVQSLLRDEGTRNVLFLKGALTQLLLLSSTESLDTYGPSISGASSLSELFAAILQESRAAFQNCSRGSFADNLLHVLRLANAGLFESDLVALLDLSRPLDISLLSCARVAMGVLFRECCGRLFLANDIVSSVVEGVLGASPLALRLKMATHFSNLWKEKASLAYIKNRVKEELLHDRYRLLERWEPFGALLSDKAYTDVVFPDHELSLEHGGFDMETTAVLRDALLKNRSITSLNLNDNQLGKFGTATIAEVLAASSSITRLNLSNNLLKDGGVEKLLEGLRKNTSVTHIALRVNNIGPDGAKLLADFLATNTSVKELILDGNDIGPQGATYFASSLIENSTLDNLGLMYNEIGDQGAAELAQLMHANKVLHLSLKGNHISKRVILMFPED